MISILFYFIRDTEENKRYMFIFEQGVKNLEEDYNLKEMLKKIKNFEFEIKKLKEVCKINDNVFDE